MQTRCGPIHGAFRRFGQSTWCVTQSTGVIFPWGGYCVQLRCASDSDILTIHHLACFIPHLSGWLMCLTCLVGQCASPVWLDNVHHRSGWPMCLTCLVGQCASQVWLANVPHLSGWTMCITGLVGQCASPVLLDNASLVWLDFMCKVMKTIFKLVA